MELPYLRLLTQTPTFFTYNTSGELLDFDTLNNSGSIKISSSTVNSDGNIIFGGTFTGDFNYANQAHQSANSSADMSIFALFYPLQSESSELHTVVNLNSTVNLEMLWVEPGTFTMGSPTTESGRSSNETEHNVTLTQGFYLGKYEVTQAQYEAVMIGNTDGLSATPSDFGGNPNRPAEQVSWNDAQIFLARLNSQQSDNIPTGWAYVLPTESQWEYACRAGTNTMYSWGNDINATRANYSSSGLSQTRDVGYYDANPWGFFDMHGNVWEWTADFYQAAYPSGNPMIDPAGPASGSERVYRGGAWDIDREIHRSAQRYAGTPSYRINHLGFRVGFQAIQPDTANPELELFGGASVTVEAGQAWSEPGVEAHDVRDGNLTSSLTVSGAVDMNTTGTYVLTYSVADAAGNEANATRTVTVVDTTHPVLTLMGDLNMTHAKDSAWVDPGATASDSLDGNLTSSITVSGTVDVNTTGVYTLTYSVSDNTSNEVNATRTVTVGMASTHTADLNASVQMEMLWVEPGTFTMGSPTTEAGRGTNETEHNVTLTKGFYLGKYEVTRPNTRR